MNIEPLTEFCLYCRKSLQQGEIYYHTKCHEESREYKKQFDNFIEIEGQMFWKKDWEIEQKLREWAEKVGDVCIYIDYDTFNDENSGLEILFVHDLRIINKSNENIPDILFFRGVQYIYLFFKSKTKAGSITYSIPKSILTLKTLKGLWIDNIYEIGMISRKRNIKNISVSLENLTKLERLFLLYEGAEFPKGLKNSIYLKEVTIGNIFTSNKIKFPTELFELQNLRIISCGFIEPEERKEIIRNLKKMKSFEMISFRDNDYNLPKRIASVNFKLKTTDWKDSNLLLEV